MRALQSFGSGTCAVSKTWVTGLWSRTSTAGTQFEELHIEGAVFGGMSPT